MPSMYIYMYMYVCCTLGSIFSNLSYYSPISAAGLFITTIYLCDHCATILMRHITFMGGRSLPVNSSLIYSLSYIIF